MFATKLWSCSVLCALPTFLSAELQAQAAWHPALGNGPSRSYHGGDYDLLRHRLVIFGGYDTAYGTYDDTWEFDGEAWTQAATAATPPARGRHAMIFDAGRSRIVLFGGTPSIFGTTALDDTWEYDGSDWVERLPVSRPSARFDHALAFDMIGGRVVLFGGLPAGPGQGGLNDTWHYDGSDWTLAAQTGPDPRHRHAMTHDFLRGRTVLFGGRDAHHYQDTWEWDGSVWVELSPTTRPPLRAGHQMVYDIARSVCVLFGGNPLDNQTWEWDGNDWVLGGATTYGRTNHVLAYDARLQRTTMHGGSSVTPGYFHATVDTYSAPVQGSIAAQGTSCAGTATTAQMSSPAAAAPPTLGGNTHIQVMTIWTHTFFVFGWSDTYFGSTPLPHDLSAYAMPGCSLQVSLDYVTSAMPNNGIANVTIAIPNNPFLVHTNFYTQGFVLDLTANAGGFVATNHLVASVGRP